jgi:hypothetical protein
MAGIRIPQKIRTNAIYILCFLSFFTAAFYNELNLRKLPPELVREGGTVITNDDASYLNPPRNFIITGIWGEDYAGNVGRFIRPPGYGLLYLPLLYAFDAPGSITAFKILQYLLFSVSVFCFFQILLILTKSKRLSFAASAFYGLSPFAVGFLSYTLTESITPSLMLFYLYLLLKAYSSTQEKKNKLYFFASLIFAFIFIVRPVLGLSGLMIPVFLFIDYRGELRELLNKMVIFGSVALSLMISWQIRNYNIAGQYVGMHPIYHPDNNTIYRAPFKAYWSFAGCWAERGDKGFSYMVPMWDAAIQGDTSIKYVNAAIDSLPEHVRAHFGETRLINVFRNYQTAILEQKPFYDKSLPMPMKMSPVENRVVEDFRELASEYKSEFPLRYYLFSPLKVFRLLAFHSNLSLYIFQLTYRGMWWMEVLRFICYAIHGLCFLFVFLNMIRIRKEKMVSLILGWIPFIYIFYLCYVQRGVEERYTLPVLPLLMIGVIISLAGFLKRIGKKN